jgi:hypothetical protein
MIAEMTPESLEGTTWSCNTKLKEKANGAVVKETECIITFYFDNGHVAGNIKLPTGETVIKQISSGTYTYQKPNVSLILDWGDGQRTTKATVIAQTMLWTDESGTIISLVKK